MKKQRFSPEYVQSFWEPIEQYLDVPDELLEEIPIHITQNEIIEFLREDHSYVSCGRDIKLESYYDNSQDWINWKER